MSFSSDIKRHTQNYRRRLDYVAKTATQSVAHEMQRPIAQEGRMPVDTGFLRSSLAASTEGMPSGPLHGEGPITGDAVAPALIRWVPGTTPIWLGFTAAYARYMEYRYGFVRSAAEKWPDFVRAAVDEAKKRDL